MYELGCAGINIEDTDHVNDRMTDIGVQSEFLGALAASLAKLPGHPVLTAWVDSMLGVIHRDGQGNSAAANAALADAIMRARAYLDAGADVVFPHRLTHARPTSRFPQGDST